MSFDECTKVRKSSRTKVIKVNTDHHTFASFVDILCMTCMRLRLSWVYVWKRNKFNYEFIRWEIQLVWLVVLLWLVLRKYTIFNFGWNKRTLTVDVHHVWGFLCKLLQWLRLMFRLNYRNIHCNYKIIIDQIQLISKFGF